MGRWLDLTAHFWALVLPPYRRCHWPAMFHRHACDRIEFHFGQHRCRRCGNRWDSIWVPGEPGAEVPNGR